MPVTHLKSSPRTHPPILATGTVQGVGSDACMVSVEGAIRSARRAAGCLIQPETGDQVLCVNDEQGRYFVLNVLQRAGSGAAVVGVDQGMVLRSENITLAAAEKLDLVAPAGVQVVSRSLGLEVEETLCRSAQTTFTGEEINSHVKRIRVFADSVETVAKSLLQRLQNCFRSVDGLDQLATRDKVESVHNLTATRARQAVIIAEEDMRIDGKRVHLG